MIARFPALRPVTIHTPQPATAAARYTSGMSKVTWIAVVLLVVVLGVWLYVSYPMQPQPAPQTAQQRIPPADTHYTPPATLALHHSVVAGANVYSGNLPIRSCNTFSGGLAASGGDPIHVQLNFRIFDGDGTCLTSTAAEDAQQPFTLSYSSKTSTKAPVLDSVSINGASIPFTLVEGK